MDTRLMELLVCPLCKGPLSHEHTTHELVCRADRLAFPLRDGMAVMLEAEARSLAPSSAASATPPASAPDTGTP
jgi:uncharacterized protein